MKRVKKGNVDLKHLIVSLLAGIFLLGFYFRTNTSSLVSNKNYHIQNVDAADNLSLVTMPFPKVVSDYGIQGKDTGVAEGHALITSSDCYTCHAEYKILLAPSFSEIAARYKNDKDAFQKLANKVIHGSVGTWGDKSMPGHPELLHEDAQKMIRYIMNLNKQKDSTKWLLN